jgi:type VI secretion system protein ImpH
MAGSGRRFAATVIDELYRDPSRFGFFQAVRLLEAAGRGKGRAAVGGDTHPRDEAVRFRSSVSLEHPVSEVARLVPGDDETGPDLSVAFMGLVGPSGVLPEHYTEHLIGVMRQKNSAFRDFLDMLSHRSVSFFYQAWARQSLPVAMERRHAGEPGADAMGTILGALVGLGTPGLSGDQPFGRDLALHHAGQLSNRRRSAATVRALVEALLAKPVEVRQFQGAWLPMEPEARTRLPSVMQPFGQHARLGQDAILGVRAWDVQAGFTVRAGPLTHDEFLGLMPDGDRLNRLVELVRFVVGPAQRFGVQLVLRADEVPRARLASASGALAQGTRLGWDAWLGNSRTARDRDDALFDAARLGMRRAVEPSKRKT